MKTHFRAAATLVALFFAVITISGLALIHQSTSANDLIAVPASAWPVQKWSWEFRLPTDIQSGQLLLMDIRSAPSKSAYGVIETQAAALDSSEAQHHATAGDLVLDADFAAKAGKGNATIQLVDLSELGVVSAKPGQDLRVLGRIGIGGISTNLTGDNIYLPPGRSAATSPLTDCKWQHGELHLMSFYVDDGKAMTKFDVVARIKKSVVEPETKR